MARSALCLLLCCTAALLAGGTGKGGHRGGPVSPGGPRGVLGALGVCTPQHQGGGPVASPHSAPQHQALGGGGVWVLRGYGGVRLGAPLRSALRGLSVCRAGCVSMAPHREAGGHGGGPTH